jgi:hypothetical protein
MTNANPNLNFSPDQYQNDSFYAPAHELRASLIDPDFEGPNIVLCATYNTRVLHRAENAYTAHDLPFATSTVEHEGCPSLYMIVVPRLCSGYIGIDLDGTLAYYEGWNNGAIGDPIQRMAQRLWTWLREGQEIRIVTARAGDPARGELARTQRWLWDNFALMIPVQNTKTFRMHQLWDDRAVQVVPNTGMTLQEYKVFSEKEKP